MICRYCGRDCKTKLGLDKHEKACDQKPEFYDRHEKKGVKCPVCRDTFRYFWKKRWDEWVCLECGCVFVPRFRVEEIERIRTEG